MGVDKSIDIYSISCLSASYLALETLKTPLKSINCTFFLLAGPKNQDKMVSTF